MMRIDTIWLALGASDLRGGIDRLFERLPTLKQRDLEQLLPHNWRAASRTGAPAPELAAVAA